MLNKEAFKRMTAARTALVINHPFFGCLVMHLGLVETYSVDTMATDGRRIYYNPDFVLQTDERELIGDVAHEAYHCSNRHHIRMAGRDLEIWNKACDYVINPDLRKAGFKLQDWVLDDPAYYGMSAEEVFNILNQQAKQQPQQKPQQGQGQGGKGQQSPSGKPQRGDSGTDKGGKGQGQGIDHKGNATPAPSHAPDPGRMGGVVSPVEGWDKVTASDEAARWETITRQAVAIARAANAGSTPAYLERLVKELNKPKVDWESKVRRFVDQSVITDYNWSSPDRRYLHAHMVLPGLVPDKLNHIVGVVDTSGSVNDKILSQYGGELKALLDDGLADKLTVIYADVKVHRVETFQRGDEIRLNPKGGGGTDFRDAFKHIKKHYDDASVILFFTDLLVRQWGEEPHCPVLWGMYGSSHEYRARRNKPPFGEVIHISNL